MTVTAHALAALHAAGFDNSWSARDFQDHIARPTDHITPLYSQDLLIGFALIRIAVDQGDLLTITVHPDYRGQGRSLHLLEAAERAAKAAGVTTMFLDVAIDNPAAIALYRRAGYVEYARRPGYYRRAEGRIGALLFQKKL